MTEKQSNGDLESNPDSLIRTTTRLPGVDSRLVIPSRPAYYMEYSSKPWIPKDERQIKDSIGKKIILYMKQVITLFDSLR